MSCAGLGSASAVAAAAAAGEQQAVCARQVTLAPPPPSDLLLVTVEEECVRVASAVRDLAPPATLRLARCNSICGSRECECESRLWSNACIRAMHLDSAARRARSTSTQIGPSCAHLEVAKITRFANGELQCLLSPRRASTLVYTPRIILCLARPSSAPFIRTCYPAHWPRPSPSHSFGFLLNPVTRWRLAR